MVLNPSEPAAASLQSRDFAPPGGVAADGATTAKDDQQQQLAKRHTRYSTAPLAVLRVIRDCQECVVRGSVFTFVHRLEGKWSGELQEFSNSPPSSFINMSRSSPRAVSTKVTYHSEGHWILRETSAAEDGAATVHYLKMSPVGSGVISVQVLQDSPGSHRHQRHSDSTTQSSAASPNLALNEVANGAHLVQRHPVSGQLSLFELIVISDDGHLTRTANIFGDTGDLESIAISRQRRVS